MRAANARLARRGARGRGFSLVELLIAMVLGLALIGGTTTIFRGNVRSAELGQAIATMQANARFALDEMAGSVRVAGSRGCASGERPMTVSATDVPVSDVDPGASALTGLRITGDDGWVPALMSGYTPPEGRAAPVAGTDALLVQYAVAPGEPLAGSMNSPGALLTIPGTMHGLEPGDLAIVTDCAEADLFRIDTRTGSAGSVALKPDRTLSRSYVGSDEAASPRRVFVLPFASAIYYVGDSGRRTRAGDAIRSLFLQEFPFDPEDNPPIELIDGVDQLRLTFGLRADDGDVRFAASDDAAFEPARVTSVRIGLLMSSAERLEPGTAPRAFALAGFTAWPEGGATPAGDVAFYPDDRRLRVPFERSVTVRNRALGARNPRALP